MIQCNECGKRFHPLGFARHRAMHRDNMENASELLQLVTHRYTIDCWYKDDGRPIVKHIDAASEEEAERLFKEQNPEMDCDPPYIYK